jgi:hypothetical protein
MLKARQVYRSLRLIKTPHSKTYPKVFDCDAIGSAIEATHRHIHEKPPPLPRAALKSLLSYLISTSATRNVAPPNIVKLPELLRLSN